MRWGYPWQYPDQGAHKTDQRIPPAWAWPLQAPFWPAAAVRVAVAGAQAEAAGPWAGHWADWVAHWAAGVEA